MAVQNTTNQSSSPKVLLYGSRYTSLIVLVLKDASETFMFKRNILLFDSIFLDFGNYVLYSLTLLMEDGGVDTTVIESPLLASSVFDS